VGIVTLEDLGNIDARHVNEPFSVRLMHSSLTITRRATLEQIAEMMIKSEEDHAFVVDENDRLIGVISGIDVVRKIMELLAA
jgi:CBS domain-containing protein